MPSGATTVSIGGVSGVRVLADGYRKGAGWGTGPWRQIRYLAPWEDSDALIDALLGTTNVVTYRGVPFPVPHAYPGNPILKCVNAEVTDVIGPGRSIQDLGVGQPDLLFEADMAVVDCLYRTLDYPVDPGDNPGGQGQFGGSPVPFAQASIRYGMKTYSLPPTALRYEDGAPYNGTQSKTMVMNTIDYVFRYEMFPGIPHTLWSSLANRVNASTFWGRPRGTFLFVPGNCDPVKSPTGGFLSSAEFTLSWQEQDHNAEPGDETGEWVILKKGDGTYTYPYADFSVLTG